MSIKTKIKRDLWHINYIIPFTTKYLQGGKLNYVKKALPVIASLEVVKGTGERDISTDIEALLHQVELKRENGSSFFYWIDTKKTIAVWGQILSNFTLDYARIIDGAFAAVADQAISVGGKYGERAKHTKYAVDDLRKRILQQLADGENDPAAKRLHDEFSVMLERPAAQNSASARQTT